MYIALYNTIFMYIDNIDRLWAKQCPHVVTNITYSNYISYIHTPGLIVDIFSSFLFFKQERDKNASV